MIKLNDSLGEKYELEKTNDDIDFSQILSHFIRKKNLIIASTILGILVGGLTALTKQRLWRGEFQIVIDTGKNKNLVNQSLLKLSGLNDLNALNETSINPLETEVAILKSPSVLMNVFEFVKLKKKNDNLRFNKWKDNSLNINLQKKTSVLNISYTDSNKEIILTVLDKISKTYQNYSGLKKRKDLQLTKNFLNNQIETYNKKNIDSISKAQKFAIDNDLTMLQGSETNRFPNTFNIESERIKAATDLRLIKQRIEKLKGIKNVSEEIMYFYDSFTKGSAGINGKIEEINKIENKLANLRIVFKENDKIISSAKKEKEFLLEQLYNSIFSLMNGKLYDAEARLDATSRPSGVLLEYGQLLSKAARDKITLESLENQFRAVSLEYSRFQEPWELITKPTLFDYAVAPNRKLILLIGLFSGFSIGLIISLILVRKEDLIYSSDQINSITDWDFITEIIYKQEENFNSFFDLINEEISLKSKGDVLFLKIGEQKESILDDIESYNSKKIREGKYIYTNNLKEISNFSNVVLLVNLGKSTNKEVKEINKRLLHLRRNIIGFITFNTST